MFPWKGQLKLIPADCWLPQLPLIAYNLWFLPTMWSILNPKTAREGEMLTEKATRHAVHDWYRCSCFKAFGTNWWFYKQRGNFMLSKLNQKCWNEQIKALCWHCVALSAGTKYTDKSWTLSKKFNLLNIITQNIMMGHIFFLYRGGYFSTFFIKGIAKHREIANGCLENISLDVEVSSCS